ncbi:MAG TPA: tetratricopeptide repeat protein, partial [Thermoanaerobaculia bacterium]|nr:tetratricopeptide repeat protein [Thermoanaerobaculia bacterium]
MTTDLISALGMFAAGLVLGGLFLYSFGRRKLVAEAADIERRDLEAKRDALLRQLRELDSSNAVEQARLEQEAAAVLRSLEHAAAPAPKKRAEARPASPAPPNAAMRGFLCGAGSVAAVALLVWLVTSQLKQRDTNEPMTGNAPTPATSNQQPATDQALQQLEAAVQQRPNDMDLRVELAKAYLDRENLMAVFEQTKIVLDKSPDNAKALTYQALVRMAMGQVDEATLMLQKATKSDPTLLDSWVGLAWIQMRAGKTREAEASIHEAAKRHPEEAARLETVLQEMKSRAAGEAPAAAAAP